jgi:hypothetical protein
VSRQYDDHEAAEFDARARAAKFPAGAFQLAARAAVLAADREAADERAWREEEAARDVGIGPWPSDEEVAEYERNHRRAG